MKIDVVIGGGPVGLFTVALLLLQNKTVFLFEKRLTYERGHMIRFWNDFYAVLISHPIFSSPRGRELRRTILGLPYFLPIRDLENTLFHWVKNQPGFYKILQEVTRVKQVENFARENKHQVERIYACDGSQSLWRKRYFESTSHFVEHILSVENECPIVADRGCYCAKEKQKQTPAGDDGILKPCSFSTSSLLALYQNRLVYTLSRGVLHIPLSEKEHQQVAHIRQRSNVDIVPLPFLKCLPATAKCHVFDYKSYWADRATHGKVLLVGDSLCGVSFARSMRNGLLCAIHATTSSCNEYELYYTLLRAQEKVVQTSLGQMMEQAGWQAHRFADFYGKLRTRLSCFSRAV